jgi:hypothetical protein
MSLTDVGTTALLPTAADVRVGDQVTRLGEEIFASAQTVYMVRRNADAVTITVADRSLIARTVTVGLGAVVDLLPPF